MAGKRDQSGQVIIKKYANRRLYDTSTSSYVTLDHLAGLIRDGVEFVVIDAKTNEDLTRSVLTQIIVEQEQSGSGALPINFLRQLIRYYDTNMTTLLPAWLEMSMNSFTEQQEVWANGSGEGRSKPPFAAFEEQARRNLELFEQAMGMFIPKTNAPPPPQEPHSPAYSDQLEEMQSQLAAMQEQIRRMSKD